jgi:hypothetical protein
MSGILKLPKCYGQVYHYPDQPDEADCTAPANDLIAENWDYGCEFCLANFLYHGGTIHPETGKKMPYLLARFLYGKPSFYIPTAEESNRIKMEKFFDELLGERKRLQDKIRKKERIGKMTAIYNKLITVATGAVLGIRNYITEIIEKICECPVCHGEGGEKHIVTDEGYGPFYPCGECHGKGTVNFFKKLWLLPLCRKWEKEEKAWRKRIRQSKKEE